MKVCQLQIMIREKRIFLQSRHNVKFQQQYIINIQKSDEKPYTKIQSHLAAKVMNEEKKECVYKKIYKLAVGSILK